MTATGIFPAFQSVMSLLDFISLTSKRFLIRDTFQGEWKPIVADHIIEQRQLSGFRYSLVG